MGKVRQMRAWEKLDRAYTSDVEAPNLREVNDARRRVRCTTVRRLSVLLEGRHF
jgi:hypothetical protein